MAASAALRLSSGMVLFSLIPWLGLGLVELAVDGEMAGAEMGCTSMAVVPPKRRQDKPFGELNSGFAHL